MRFKDEVIIITGASRGLGRALAMAFASEGGRVVLVSTNTERGQQVAKEIQQGKVPVLFIQADITRPDQVKRMVRIVRKQFGTVDVLVNNAGIHAGAPFLQESWKLWNRLYRVNVWGSVLTTQAVVPMMIEKHRGKIIFISSKAAIVGEPGHTAYTASKGAVLAITRALAIELAPYHITVNAVCPGPFQSDMLLAAMPREDDRERLAASVPLGRLGRPEDITGAVLYLASRDSDWCTGQFISVDGGMSILM